MNTLTVAEVRNLARQNGYTLTRQNATYNGLRLYTLETASGRAHISNMTLTSAYDYLMYGV